MRISVGLLVVSLLLIASSLFTGGTPRVAAQDFSAVVAKLDSAKRGVFPVAVQIAGTDEYVTGWIEQGTVLVDAKALAALLKGAVFWDPQSKTLTLAVGGMRLKFVQGSSFMDADGQRIVLPAPMTQDRKLPLKPIVAVLGGTVQVDTTAFRALIQLCSAPQLDETPFEA